MYVCMYIYRLVVFLLVLPSFLTKSHTEARGSGRRMVSRKPLHPYPHPPPPTSPTLTQAHTRVNPSPHHHRHGEHSPTARQPHSNGLCLPPKEGPGPESALRHERYTAHTHWQQLQRKGGLAL